MMESLFIKIPNSTESSQERKQQIAQIILDKFQTNFFCHILNKKEKIILNYFDQKFHPYIENAIGNHQWEEVCITLLI